MAKATSKKKTPARAPATVKRTHGAKKKAAPAKRPKKASPVKPARKPAPKKAKAPDLVAKIAKLTTEIKTTVEQIKKQDGQ